MQYRAATSRDFRAMQGLLHQLNPEGGMLETDQAQWDRLITHPGTTVYLAEEAEPLATMVLHVLPNMTYNASPYALIENVVTREDQRGRGIGRGLMAFVLDRALEAGCYKVMLLTGVARGAKDFYLACGFSDQEKLGLVRYLDQSENARRRRGDKA